MKKKRLSEVAINATTLNGKAASYYDHEITGWNSLVPSNRRNISNLTNPDMKTGVYFTLGSAEGKPPGTTSGFVFVLSIRVGLLSQVFINNSNTNTYVRSYTDGTWSEWKGL